MKKIITYLKIEGILTFRSIDILLVGVFMPIGIAALIAAIAGGKSAGEGYTYLQVTFGALMTVGICATALMGLPLCLADYRDKKILKQFFVTPVSPAFLLVMQSVINAIFATSSAILVYLLLRFCFGYRMTGNPGMVIVSFFVLMIAMYGVGMLIASLCQTIKEANLVCTLVYFPMLFLSGATVPYEVFPDWLQKAANIMPLTVGIKLLKGYSLSQNPEGALLGFIVLGLVAVVSIVLSLKFFKWE